MQRSFLLFTNGLKSKETVRQYIFYVEKFMKFYEIKDYNSLTKIPPEKLQIMVEDYVMDLKKRVSPNTVPTSMYAIQAFFESNDIDELEYFLLKNQSIEDALIKLQKRGYEIGYAEQAIESPVDPELFPRKIRYEAERMANFYILYYCMENSIRQLIKQVLSEKDPNWWEY